jgi:hypothetical protein
MSRVSYWQYLLDKQGNPLQEAEVRVYLAGTYTEANIYLDSEIGNATISSIEDLKTDKYGFIQFWIGDYFELSSGYGVDQNFRIVWKNTVDSIEEEIDNLRVFDPVRQIDTTDSIIGVPSNKDFDKTISNTLGYKWNQHVESTMPSDSPHDLESVVLFDTDDLSNKVISNKLGYQLYQIAYRASTTSTDTSASRFYSETVNSWNSSGGFYYKDIEHNFDNYYPIVRLSKNSNGYHLEANKIESIDENTTRVWITDNINIVVSFYG